LGGKYIVSSGESIDGSSSEPQFRKRAAIRKKMIDVFITVFYIKTIHF
jgi:hypothetical protein